MESPHDEEDSNRKENSDVLDRKSDEFNPLTDTFTEEVSKQEAKEISVVD